MHEIQTLVIAFSSCIGKPGITRICKHVAQKVWNTDCSPKRCENYSFTVVFLHTEKNVYLLGKIAFAGNCCAREMQLVGSYENKLYTWEQTPIQATVESQKKGRRTGRGRWMVVKALILLC